MPGPAAVRRLLPRAAPLGRAPVRQREGGGQLTAGVRQLDSQLQIRGAQGAQPA